LKLRTLIFRSLLYYRGLNAALVLGVALATAILTGSLLVGDSVRGSLRELALARLGPIQFVLAAPQPFDAALAQRLNRDAEALHCTVSPMFALKGRAVRETTMPQSASGVSMYALGGDSWKLLDAAPDTMSPALAEALGNPRGGDALVLTFPQISDLPVDAVLGRRARADVLASLRMNLRHVDVLRAFSRSLVWRRRSARRGMSGWTWLHCSAALVFRAR
jgi:hypothetical protein